MAASMEQLTAYIAKAQSADVHVDDIFQGLIHEGMGVLEMKERDLAAAFGTSVPTIKRWTNGGNIPAKGMRTPIVGFLIERAIRCQMECFNQSLRLRAFIQRSQDADLQAPGTFQALVHEGLGITCTRDRTAAVALKTSVTTIYRWKHGLAAPSPSVRPQVIAYFVKQAATLLATTS